MKPCEHNRVQSARGVASRASFLLFLISSALANGQAMAQNPDPGACLSSARILERYIESLGGQAALSRIQTRVSEVEALEPSFKPGHPNKRKYTIEWKSPNSVVFKNHTAIFNPYTFKFDGNLLWGNMRGKAVLVGGNGAGNAPFTWMVRVLADPLVFARPDQLYLDIPAAHYDFTPSHNFCVLYARPKADPKGKHILYFDAQTGRLKVLEIPYRGGGSLFIYFDDYRDLAGIEFPFHIHCSNPLGIAAQFQKVLHNQPLHDKDFLPQ